MKGRAETQEDQDSDGWSKDSDLDCNGRSLNQRALETTIWGLLIKILYSTAFDSCGHGPRCTKNLVTIIFFFAYKIAPLPSQAKYPISFAFISVYIRWIDDLKVAAKSEVSSKDHTINSDLA